jgi:hypothetical protein
VSFNPSLVAYQLAFIAFEPSRVAYEPRLIPDEQRVIAFEPAAVAAGHREDGRGAESPIEACCPTVSAEHGLISQRSRPEAIFPARLLPVRRLTIGLIVAPDVPGPPPAGPAAE